MNILFTCAGRRVSLLGNFRAAMKELNLSGKLIATDITQASPAFHKADLGIKVPPARRIEYIPAIQEIVKQHNVRLLVPLTDLDLRSLARHRDEFAALGCTVMIGSESAITLCRDKAQTNALIGRAGLATIRTFTLSEFLAQPFYPCFVKPISGSASVGTGIMRNEKELRGHVSVFGDLMIIQEYVPGAEFTVDVYRQRSGAVRCVVPRQRLQVRSGEVEKGLTVKDDEMIRCATVLAEALPDMWGVFCCQCRRSGNGPPRFFEINPRFGGGAPLSMAAGANLPLYLLQDVLGLPITAEIGNFTDRLLMLRYDDALFLQVNDDFDQLPGFKAPSFR
jgi:carbamoyl-phosphate synthase large subunit